MTFRCDNVGTLLNYYTNLEASANAESSQDLIGLKYSITTLNLGLALKSETTYTLELGSIDDLLKQLDVVDHRDEGDVCLVADGNMLYITRLLRKKELVKIEVSVAGHFPFPLQIKWKRLKHLLTAKSDMVRIVLKLNAKGKGTLRVDNMIVEFEPLTQQFSLPFSHSRISEEPKQRLLERIAKIDIENTLTGINSIEAIVTRYERDRELVKLMKLLRGSQCQICNYSFKTIEGEDYCECHHLEHLSNNGLDVSKNILVLCANHHRQFHFGQVKILFHSTDRIDISIDGSVHVCEV